MAKFGRFLFPVHKLKCLLPVRVIALLALLGSFTGVGATTYYSKPTTALAGQTLANWNTSWSGTTATGTTPANFTTAGDVFILQATSTSWTIGAAWTVTGDVIINGTISNSSKNNTLKFGTLTINSGGSLTDNAALTITGATIITGTFTLSQTKTYTFSSDVTLNSGAVWNESAAAVVVFKGNFTNNATTFTASTGTHTFSGASKTISGSTTATIANVAITGSYTNNGKLTVSTLLSGAGSLTNGATGTLSIGGTSAPTITTLVTTTTGNTVNYSGGAQTISANRTFYNLTISGTAAKTFPTGTVTVNGTFSVENSTFANTYTGSLAYGSTATLQYNAGSSARTVGAEWPSPFTATGGVIIKGTGIITLNGAKQLGSNTSVPLNITSGAKLTTSNNALTFHGDFINAGTLTAGSSTVTISGTTATQSIGTYTTTGLTTLSKTSGTATFTGAVSGAALTINGNGGTLNLGTALSHTFSGTVTMTAGTLNGGSSTLNLTSTGTVFSGTGATFDGGTGTVNYSGGSAQTMGALTYYNLTLSGGSFAKTFDAGTTTVTGTLSIENGTTANVFTGSLVYGAAATLQYNAGTSARTVGAEWPSTFTATGGVIIKGSGTITLNGAKQLGNNTSVPLNINSGATLATSNNALTFHGDFIKAGTLTAGSSTVTLAGTVSSQSIGAFTTTGLVSMTKTAGTATFTGNVGGAGLTINGSGGTLHLGTSLTHTFTGDVTLTAGTLNGGTGTLNVNPTSTTAWNGTGSLFTVNKSTVVFGGANQTISASSPAFYNVTFSGSGTKTVSNTVTVSNALNISASSILLSLPGSSSTARVFQEAGVAQTGGTWGSSTSSATNKTTAGQYFTGSGMLNASTSARFIITGSLTQTAGSSQVLTITAASPNGTTSTTYSGSKSLTFSGPSNSPGPVATSPTVRNSSGTTVNYGSPISVTFTSGVATITSTLYDAENALISVTDGTITSVNDDQLAVTVSAATQQLNFSTQPGGGVTNSIWGTQPVITVRDQYGNLSTSTKDITLAISNNAGPGGVLAGTTLVTSNISTAQAVFTDLAIDVAGTGYTLVASATGLSSVTSSSFTISNPVPTVTSVPSPFLCSLTSDFTITVNGTNFNSTSVVYINGVARTTTYVSATQLTAAVLASDIASFATPSVVVTNPAPGGGSSTATPFTLNYTYVSANAVITQPTCYSSGKISLTGSGGTAPYTFDWNDISGTNNTQNRIGLDAGTYSVTVTDANGCSASSGNLVLVAATGCAPTNVCKSDVASIFSTDPDPDNTSYTWTVPSGAVINSGQGTLSISVNWTGVAIGTYQVCVVANNVCGTSISSCQSVNVKAPEISAYADPACTTGTLKLYVYGGISNSWTGPNSFTSNLAAPQIYNVSSTQNGTYTVTTTDAAGCSAFTTVTVAINTTPTVTSTVVSTTCNNSNGSITLSASGGSGFSYAWDDGSTANPYTGLASGNYSVTVTNSSGCSIVKDFAVVDTDGPSASLSSTTNVSCYGSSTGAINITSPTGGTAPYTYLWSDDNSTSTQNISGLAAGVYNVQITDANGCQAGVVATITQPSGSLLTDVSVTNINCYGASTGAINLSVSGGTSPYTYAWSKSGGGFTSTSQNISSLAAGTYSVIVTDSKSCTTSLSVTVSQPSAALSGSTSVTAVKCFGGTTGQITSTISGGTSPYTYSWSKTGGGYSASTSGISSLSAGTYSVLVTDSKGCTLTLSATVTQPAAALSVSLGSSTPVSCYQGSNGSLNISVTGGTTAYSYLWSNGATTQNISSLVAGTYSVVVTDASSCSASFSSTVSQPSAALSVTATPSATTCNSASTGSITLSVSGGTSGYTYLWSNSATTQNVSGLAIGTYSVTVTDSKSCTAFASAIVTQPTAIAVTGTVTNVLCNGASTGAIAITATGGSGVYSYTWSNEATTSNISGLAAGTYSVSVTDGNGCTGVQSFTITQPSALSLSMLNENVTCNGSNNGGINLTVSGGLSPYTYAWTKSGGGFTATTEDITGLSAGTYIVTVTDANGCTASLSSTAITQPAALAATTAVLANVTCFGGSNGSAQAIPTGGNSPYTYLWSNSATGQIATNLTAGTYTVIVTDSKGCTTSASATITEPAAAIAVFADVVDTRACAGSPTGSISLTVQNSTGLLTYAWSGPTSIGNVQNPTGLAAGTYSVTVTSSAGCTASLTTTVGTASALSVSVTGFQSSCAATPDGSVYAVVSGGVAPYTYLWNNSSTQQSISGLSSGTFSVTVTDANGCTASGNATLTAPTCVFPVAVNDVTSTVNGATVSNTVQTNDSDAGYPNSQLQFIPNSIPDASVGVFTWNDALDGSYTYTPANGFVGVVTVPYKLFNPLGLVASAVLTINVYNTTGDVNVTSVNIPVSGDVSTNDNLISGTSYGNPGAPTSKPIGSTASLTMNTNGTYTFQADMAGVYVYSVPVCAPGVTSSCPTSTLTITVNAALAAGSISGTQALCAGALPVAFGSLTPASGGTGTINYQWQKSINNSTFTNIVGATSTGYVETGILTQTTYYRRAASTGIDPTVYTSSITVTVNPLPTISISPVSASITLGMTVTLTASGADTYSWTPAATLSSSTGTSVIATPEANTTYVATGTISSTGCSSSGNVAVIVNPKLTAGSIGSDQIICTGTSPLSALGNITSPVGGTGTISYQWQQSLDNVNFTNIPLNATSASYTVGTLTQTTYYRRAAYTSVDAPAYTGSVTITVLNGAGGTLSGAASVCTNINNTPLNLSGVSGTITKWQSSTTPDFTAGVTDIVNTTTSLTAANLTTTTYYRAVVVASSGLVTCPAVYSSAVTITVNPLPTVVITPSSVAFTIGNSSTLTASGASTYNWSPSPSLANPTNVAAVVATPVVTTTYQVAGTDNNGCVNTANVVVTVNPRLIAGNIIQDQTICLGDLTPLTAFTSAATDGDASGGTGTISYKWQSSLDNVTFTDVTTLSPTFSSYQSGTLTQTTYFRRGAQTPNDNMVFSNSVVVTVQYSEGGSISGSTSVCAGTNSTILSLSGIKGTVTKWQLSTDGTNWSDIGGTSGTTAIATSNLLTTTYYRALVQFGTCNAVNSATATITVNPVPTVAIAAGSLSLTNGQSTTLTASGASTYVWSPNSGLSPSNTASTITISPTSDITYTVIGTTALGCTGTASVTITVVQPALQPGLIAMDQLICTGTATQPLTSTTSATGGTGNISYQWQISTDNINFTNIPLATTEGYDAGTLTQTTYYRRSAVTDSGLDPVVYSNVVKITVQESNAGTLTGSATVCAGTNNTNLSLTGITGSITTWQSSPDGSTWSNINDGNTTTSRGVTNLMSDTYYRALVQVGTCPVATSNTISITVIAPPVVSITPTSFTIPAGSSATISVSGNAQSYLWTPSTGLNTTTSATVIASPRSTITYQVTGTLTVGGCTASQTASVTVVLPLTPGVIAADQTICSGTAPAGFTSTGDASGGVGAITYQWQSSTDNINFTDIIGATAATYGAGTLTQTTYYRRGAQTTTEPYIYTNAVKVTIQTPVGGTINGGAVAVCAGTNNTNLSLTGFTGSITKWQSATSADFSTGLTDITNTTSSLTASNLTTTTYYRAVVLLGSCATVTSTTATITVNPLPNVAITPTSVAISSGLSTTLTASGANTYSWVPSTGLGSTNTISVTAAPTGTTVYVVTGTNTVTGCINTATSTVTVNNPLIGGSISADQIICVGTAAAAFSSTVDASGGTGAISYQWEKSTDNINFTSIVSATGLTYTAGTLNQTTYYRRAAVTSNDPTRYSNTVIVTVNPLPTISGVSGTLSVCSGFTTTLTASSAASQPVYKWYTAASGGTLLSTGAAYTTSALTSTTSYYIEVTSGDGCVSATRTTATVTVNSLPTISAVTGTLTICAGLTTTLTASSAASTPTYNWYAAATGGTALFTGAAYTTSALTTTTTFYVEVTNGTGCTSLPRTASTVTVNALPTISGVTGTTSICSGISTTLTASSGANTPTYNWYSASTGGTLLSTTAAYATAALTNTTTFYVSVTSGEGCTSSSRLGATVTVNTSPTISGVSGTLSICSGTGTTLTANSVAIGPVYTWYDAASGGNLLHTGAAYTTAALTATTTYYIEVTSGAGCVSASRTAATVTVNALPTISSVSGTLTVCSGTSTILTASSAASSPVYKWYAAASGGSALLIGATLATANLTTTTTFYVEVTDGGGCVSASRTAVSVDINPLPTISGVTGTMTICSGLTTTLTAASGANTPTYKWYTASGGGTLLSTAAAYTTSALTTTTTFYIEVTSGEGCVSASRTATTVTVNPLPTISGVSGTMTICSGFTTTLTAASGANTPTYKWYSASSGGTLLHTGAAYTTSTLTTTTTFYIEVTSGEGCVSAARTATTVIVNSLPTISSVSGTLTICSGLTTTLTASSGANTPTFNWYSASSGGTLLSTSATYTTSALTSTTTFYIEVTSGEGCVSASRTANTVTVNPLPTISGVTGIMTICSGLTTTLTASSGANTPTYKWYNASSGGTLLFTGAAYTTAALTATTSFYIEVTSGEGCVSASRTSTTVTVNPLPTISGVTGIMTICSGLTTTLTASSGANTPTYKWYNASSGGTLLFTGAAYTTAALTATTSFYIEVTSGEGCVSASRTSTTVTVNPLPTISGVTGTMAICSGLTTTLTASSGANTPTYKWYSASTGGTLLATSAAYGTAALTTTTTFYIEVTSGEGCVSASRTASTVTVNPLPTISGVTGTMTICSGLSTTLTANSGANTPTYSWYSASTGGSLLATGAMYTASGLTTTTTYYVSVTSGEGCSSVTRTAATVTVNALPTISGISGALSVCPGLTTTLTASSGANTPTYNWYSASTGGTSLSTGAAYTTSALTTTTTYYVEATSGQGCVSLSRTAATVTVSALPTISGISGSLTLCSGFATTLTASSGANTPTYKWYTASTGGTLLSTGEAYTTSALTATTSYYVEVTNGEGCVSASRTTATVTVNALPTISGVSGTLSVCPGVSTTLTASSGASTPTYNWYSDITGGTLLSTGAAYATSALTTTTFYVDVTNGDGCVSASRTAATLTITPLPVLAITASSQTFGISGTVLLTVSGADSYSWSPTGTLTSVKGDSLTATVLATTLFTATGTFSPSGCLSTSTINIVVINPGSIGSDQAGCGAFTPTTLTSVTPAGDASGTAALTYQWQSAIISPANTFANIPGATDSTYTPTAPISQTTYYRRVVTSGGVSVISNIVTATVNAVPAVTISPTSITMQKGFTATITAAGATTYAWSPSTDLSSATTATVITSAVSSTTYSVTGTADGCSSILSVDVTVIDPGTIGTNQVNCGPFTPATLTSIADASGTATLTYQWQSSTVSATGGFTNISAATTTAYTPADAITTTTYYRRIATGADASYSSNVITATVNALPVISINPTSLTVAAGLTATLTGSGADTYTWSPSTALSSTTTAAVIASPVTNTAYSVVGTVTASGCSGTASVIVTVSSPGTLKPGTIDSSQTICSLSTPTAFTSTPATGGLGTINYQWQMSTDSVNFTNIIGATSATYAAGALSQTTYYRRGASTSNDPVVYTQPLKVSVLPKPVIIGGINGPCAMPRDTIKTFSVNGSNATRYVWTIPSTGGWSGSSTTSSINIKAGTTNGVISVTPYNGSCAGTPVSYAVSIIDYAQVTISGTPVTASGNNNNPIKVTITLIDVVGNILTCSGGPATLCANSGTFTTVVDNGDGTYTSYLTSSANDVTICGAVAGVQISKTTKVTFTGPQGGIKTNGPILDFEIPKITFTATDGRAPFTVIYHSAKSPAGKNDTLTNVTSGKAYNMKLIPSTTLYTLVSVIDANGERRDNNFIRDTSTTVVLAPKVIITLKADAPKKEPDSTWATRIVVHTKNIGDLDLSNAQARLNLKTVFPSPVTYVLDSVRVSGKTVVLNRNYDGVVNEDLFAKLNKDKRNIYSRSVPAGELGLGELVSPDGSAGIEMWSNGDSGQDDRDEFEVVNNGHSIYMFGPSSALPINGEATIILWLHVKPNGYTDPFVMQAVALGTGSTDGATALTTSLSNDNEEVSAHPEVTKQGDPLPAVINLFPTAVIGASLNAGTPVLQSDGSFNVPLTYNVKNYGNVNLKNVQLSQNLLRAIGLPSTFTVVGPVTSTGNLIPNPAFNAKSDTNMLLPANSILGYKQEATLSYVINIKPNQVSSVYRLQAIASGYSDDILATVTDLSNDGFEPDTDGNNIPSEKVITVIVINLPIPPLTPGSISTPAAKCVSASSVVISQVTAPGGGLDSYQYQWQSSVNNMNFFDIAGAESSSYTTGVVNTSTYYRRATISGNQVKYSNAVLLQIYPAPATPVISGTGSMIVGKGNITLSGPSAAAYSWSTGATTKDIYVQDAGSYGLTITDANGCTAVAATYSITSLDPNKVADVQKILSKAPALQSDGSFLLSFNILASNLRTELLDSVKLKDDLSKVFPSYSTFSIVDIKASGALIANNLYDGKTQIDLLSDVSKLAGSKTDSVQITIKVFPNGFNGVLNNTATLNGRSPYGTVSVVSNDPVHNSNPSIKLPTKFTIPVVDIFIPSGFSPNKDGFNDKFVIIRPYNTTINLEIFNRWSNLVYRSSDYKNEWDGKGNQVNRLLGDDLPDGTYYYVVLATDKVTGTVRKFAGVVTIKR